MACGHTIDSPAGAELGLHLSGPLVEIPSVPWTRSWAEPVIVGLSATSEATGWQLSMGRLEAATVVGSRQSYDAEAPTLIGEVVDTVKASAVSSRQSW